MTTDIEKLASEAGLTDAHLAPWMTDYGYCEEEIRKFAALVAEECAKTAALNFIPGHSVAGPGFAKNCADRIRAKFPMP